MASVALFHRSAQVSSPQFAAVVILSGSQRISMIKGQARSRLKHECLQLRVRFALQRRYVGRGVSGQESRTETRSRSGRMASA